MKYSLPIMGCLCLSCRGESCVGGAGAPEGSPPLREPPLLPSVPPTVGGLVAAVWRSRLSHRRGGTGIRRTRAPCLVPPLLASDRASDVLALSLSLLTYIMGSTTLPASQCEDAVSCQHKAVSTDGAVRGCAGRVRPEASLGMFQVRTRGAR